MRVTTSPSLDRNAIRNPDKPAQLVRGNVGMASITDIRPFAVAQRKYQTLAQASGLAQQSQARMAMMASSTRATQMQTKASVMMAGAHTVQGKAPFSQQGGKVAQQRQPAPHDATWQFKQSRSGGGTIQLKSQAPHAANITAVVRNTYGVVPGNRADEIVDSGGKSYAGFAMLDYLYKQDASGNWGDYVNRRKRATLAYHIGAANCDQFGDLAYCCARQDGDADVVAVEGQPGHTYAVMYDNADKNQPGEQAIIDPWVSRGGLRKDQGDYYQSGYTQYNPVKADGMKWYIPNYYDTLSRRYGRAKGDSIYNATANEGLGLATRKKSGENIGGIF